MARVGLTVRVLGALFALAAPLLADAPRADELFREGNRAFAAGDARAAYQAYREAWSLRKSFDIACNLGRTEAELSLSRDAAEHLDYCIRTYPASSREDLRQAYQRFQELFAEVRARVAALRLETKPQGAEVSVDGVTYGTTPREADVFVDPGQHRVRAELVGFRPEERVVDVAAGATLAVGFSLLREQGVPAAAVAPAAAAHSATPERRTASVRTTVVLSGAAVTLVGLGLGTGFFLDARAKNDRVNSLGFVLRENVGPLACSSASPPSDCAALADAVHDEQRARDRADVAFTAAGIVAGATIVAWLLIPDDAEEAGGAARVTPWFTASGTGVSVEGTY